MRIGIDARPLISESPSGIGIYLLEILKNLLRDEEHTYILYSNAPIKNKAEILKSFEQRVIKGGVGTLAICFGLKKYLKEDQIDVFWGTEHMLPLNVKRVKKILTVHDLALLVNPSWGSRKNAIMQNIFCRASCKCADHIIAVSEATKRDLINMLSIEKSSITAILNGGGRYSNVTFSSKRIFDIEKRIGICGKPFFAYTGNIEPRKNIVGIIDAFNKLNDKYNGKFYLVLAGKMGWRTKPILSAIENSQYKDNIILPGYISEDEKKYLMSYSIAFVFPSNYEGFGIPIVEALSCGGIVITATNSSLPEVGGSVSFYVTDTKNSSALASKMEECFNLSQTKRIALTLAGKAWAEKFSWKKCARETQTVLER